MKTLWAFSLLLLLSGCGKSQPHPKERESNLEDEKVVEFVRILRKIPFAPDRPWWGGVSMSLGIEEPEEIISAIERRSSVDEIVGPLTKIKGVGTEPLDQIYGIRVRRTYTEKHFSDSIILIYKMDYPGSFWTSRTYDEDAVMEIHELHKQHSAKLNEIEPDGSGQPM